MSNLSRKIMFLYVGISLSLFCCVNETQQKSPKVVKSSEKSEQSSTASNLPENAQATQRDTFPKGGRMPRPKKDELLIMTWNLYNFGKSKTPEQIKMAAQVMRYYDIVAIQEVSTSEAGARAVAQLADELDRTGANWDYTVSDATSGDGSERYAFLWNSSRARIKQNGFLCQELAPSINREPFLARFEAIGNKKTVLLASFHAVPTAKKPATEIEQLDKIHQLYPADNVLIMGDFNYSGAKPAFDKLRQVGYAAAIKDLPTSLRRILAANGSYFNEEYDNIFYETAAMDMIQADRLDVVQLHKSLEEARDLSDHVPVWIKVKVK